MTKAVGKTGRRVGAGVGDYWVKPGDWELGDHVNEVCCFDSKLEWVKVCSKVEDTHPVSFAGCCSGGIF